MAKRLQNAVSESRLTLPVVAAYACGVWIAGGLVAGGLWVQFACFALATYLMVELNNSNALIRVYSRMVSCSFLMLSCALPFLFMSQSGAAAGLCIVGAYSMLFRSYQDSSAVGRVFYAFACIGIASLFHVHIIYYIPVVWLLMTFCLRSMSLRTFASSLIGLCAPYWFLCVFLVYDGGFPLLAGHFAGLARFVGFADYTIPGAPQVMAFAFLLVIAVTGIVHYQRNSRNDKIRIRMYYMCFIVVDLVSILFAILQPQHYDLLLRMMIINTSPLIAHFIALTRTRVTNVAFCVIVASVILMTVYNLWMPSLISL